MKVSSLSRRAVPPMSRALMLTTLVLVKRGILFVVACKAYRVWRGEGVRGLLGASFQALRSLPFVDSVVDAWLAHEAKLALDRQLSSMGYSDDEEDVDAEGNKGQDGFVFASGVSGKQQRLVMRLPRKGLSRAQVLEQLLVYKKEATALPCAAPGAAEGALAEHFKVLITAFQSVEPESGAGIDHDSLLRSAFATFLHDHLTTDPTAFPILRRFETEVVGMTSSLVNGEDDGVVGCLTSGGTESILMAVKAYRDHARKQRPYLTTPEMIVPVTAHPAFTKAAHYFGLRIVHVPVGPDSRAEVEAVAGAITQHTILIVASAPQQPHGVVDPISALGELAEEHDLPLHVDAGCGGFMLQWLERLGHVVPVWDFRVPGVSSISMDLHKYAYTLKGSGVLLYRSREVRACQYFAYVDWPGGLFGSTGLAPRSGGGVAAAWAAMVSLGEDGYLELARSTAEAAKRIKEGVRAIEGLGLVAESEMTSLAICSRDSDLNILTVADVLERKGWRLERQQWPTSLHLSVMPQHIALVDHFLRDLRYAVSESQFPDGRLPTSPRQLKILLQRPPINTAPMYTMLSKLPDRQLVSDFIVKYIDETYRLQPTVPTAVTRVPSPRNGSNGRPMPLLLRHHSSKELELMEGVKEEEEGEVEEEEAHDKKARKGRPHHAHKAKGMDLSHHPTTQRVRAS